MAHKTEGDCPLTVNAIIRKRAKDEKISITKMVAMTSKETGIPEETLSRWVWPRKTTVKNDSGFERISPAERPDGRSYESNGKDCLGGMKIYKYYWGNNPVRQRFKGRECILLAVGKRNSALIEFIDTKERLLTSRRAIRRFSNDVKSGVENDVTFKPLDDV